MDKMRVLLNMYKNVVPEIFKLFGNMNGYGEIDVKTDVKWNMNGYEVHWIENEVLYSNEIRNMNETHKYENYVLLFVDNGCGEQYYQIFDSNLIDKDLTE